MDLQPLQKTQDETDLYRGPISREHLPRPCLLNEMAADVDLK
jgi:hypothetical protein